MENKQLPRGLWRDDKTGKIALERCPKCGRENYIMNVLSGRCTWCGFDANKEYGKEYGYEKNNRIQGEKN